MLTHGLSESHAPARVVILGANGFVPQALQQRLTQNQWPFLALGSQSLDLTDLTSGTKLAAILRPNDALVMTAALTPEKGRDVATLIRNLRMVETVGAALAIQPIAHLVYFSSDAVYDARESVISEDTATAPADLYGIMHLAREVALTPIAAKGAVPFCVLRPCAIYGRGDTHNSYGPNRFVRTATKEGVIRLFGAGEETRDHVSIDNVVAATLRVLERRSTGTVNLVSGQSLSFGDVARLIVSQAGKPVTIESLPRSGPVTHRSFTTLAWQSAFPDLSTQPLREGLAALLRPDSASAG